MDHWDQVDKVQRSKVFPEISMGHSSGAFIDFGQGNLERVKGQHGDRRSGVVAGVVDRGLTWV